MIPWRLLLALGLAATLAGCATSRGGGGDACAGPAPYAAVAKLNAASLDQLDWSPFGAPERGWRIYAPRIAQDLGTDCAPDSPGFAARLAPYGDGALTPAVFDALKSAWQQGRPFVRLRAQGICPAPPDEAALVPMEGFGGKTVLLDPGAAKALARMQAAARQALADPAALAPFSAYRSPAYDDARCARDGDCQGVTRARCSAHRTGRAVDLALGAAPGFTVDASAAENRLFQTATPAYRWLLAHAARFGFVNYVFEPWHWEWTGEAGAGTLAP